MIISYYIILYHVAYSIYIYVSSFFKILLCISVRDHTLRILRPRGAGGLLEAAARVANTAEPLAQWSKGLRAAAHQLAAAGLGPSLSRRLQEEALCGAGELRRGLKVRRL